MTQHRIEPDSGPDLVFDGERIAHVSSHEPGRDQWSELSIYRTAAGAYVAVRQRHKLHDDDGDIAIAAAHCPTSADVVSWFHAPPQRPSWLTKELLDAAGIDHAERIA